MEMPTGLTESCLEFLSWIGTFVLIIRGLPQAVRSWKEGHSNGLSGQMLWLWLIGSFLVLPHLILMEDYSSGIVYCANITFVLIILKFFYFPRK